MSAERAELGQDPFSIYTAQRADALDPVGAPVRTSTEQIDVLALVVDLPVEARYTTLVVRPDGSTTLSASDGDPPFTSVSPGPLAELARSVLGCAQRDLALFPVDPGNALPSHRLVQFTVLTTAHRRRRSVPLESFWSGSPPEPRATIRATRTMIEALRNGPAQLGDAAGAPLRTPGSPPTPLR